MEKQKYVDYWYTGTSNQTSVDYSLQMDKLSKVAYYRLKNCYENNLNYLTKIILKSKKNNSKVFIEKRCKLTVLNSMLNVQKTSNSKKKMKRIF